MDKMNLIIKYIYQKNEPHVKIYLRIKTNHTIEYIIPFK